MNFLPFQGMEARRQIEETVAVSRSTYFSEFSLLIVLSSHSRAYTPRAGLTPPTHPSNLYDRCFSFSFSKPNFSLRNFSIFSFSPRKDENFAFHLQLFDGRSKLSSLPLNARAFEPCVPWRPALGRLFTTNFRDFHISASSF